MPVMQAQPELAKISPPRALPPGRARTLIFLSALLLKTSVGVLFLGSVDLVNSVTNSLALLSGAQVHLPYFPTINAFLWLGGMLAAAFRVPLPLALKLVPILFDSLLAVLIYDLVRRQAPHSALRAGLLYAFNPLGLLITSFHGQWDAAALFFLLLAFGLVQDGRPDTRKEYLFGVLFAISILIKPIGLFFVALFPSRKRWLLSWRAMLGAIAAFGIGYGIFSHYGYSTILTFVWIVLYSAKGIQTFGLPFTPLLAHWQVGSYRLLWLFLGIIVLGDLYQRRKLAAMDAMLLFYLVCVATTGLSPQYLIWPLPLLMLSGRLRLAAFYTAVSTAFLVVYYSNPFASYNPFENLGVFSSLRGLAWLLPPAILERHELVPLVQVLGDIVFPICAALVFALVIRDIRGKMARCEHRVDQPGLGLGEAGWYAAPLFVIFGAILAARLTLDGGWIQQRLVQAWNALPANYGLRIQSFDPKLVLVREAHAFGPLNVVVLLTLFTAAWCVQAGRARDQTA